ncbi:MAG TPA: MFS transporter, partial [Ktedonobacteraceae bacterium]|nr:MFS transporter [Ktedonobacteraceae bacterium]
MMSIHLKMRIERSVIENMLPIISASTIGSVIQWFDFYLYSFLAVTIFPTVFFPTLSPFAGTLISFVIGFIGFAARPCGAAFFGWFGDRVGRQSTLVATLLLMGSATIVMGILPGYATWGIASPILLILLRLMQGIGVGGEWGGATLLALENSDEHNRGFWTSWPQAGVPIGLASAIIATLLCQVLYPGEAYQSVGWRVPFFLSPMLLIAGFYIRLHIPETPLFAQIKARKQEAKAPLRDVCRYFWREVILCTLLRFGDQAPFYLFTTFSLSYSVEVLHLPAELIYIGLIIASLIEVPLMPLIGIVSDHIGRKRCYLLGCAGMAGMAFPYFWLLNTRNPWLVLLAIILSFDIGHVCLFAPQAALIAEQFSTKVRYTGASLGFQLSSVIAGGPAPIVATYLMTTQAKLLPGPPA